MTRNYHYKLMRNYQLVYYIAQKCANYRDTGVSKNVLIRPFLSFLIVLPVNKYAYIISIKNITTDI